MTVKNNEQLTNLHGWQRVEISKETIITSGIATNLLCNWNQRFAHKGENKESSSVSKFYGPNRPTQEHPHHLLGIPVDANLKEEFSEVCMVKKSDNINSPPKKKPRLDIKRQDQPNMNDLDEDSILQLYAN